MSWDDLVMWPWFYPLAGGLAIALVCSLLSVLVVLRRMAFIGEGVAHAAFGGAGVALLAGLWLPSLVPPMARDAVIAAFCVAAAVAIGFLSRRGKLAEDTSIGIALVAAMALGFLLLDIRQQAAESMGGAYTPPLEGLLFGQILFLGPAETLAAWGLAIVTLALVLMTFKELTFFAFDEETAGVFGVPTGVFYYGLLILLGLAIVAATRSVGIILVSALLVLPGASAKLLSARIGMVTLLSVLIGLAGMALGLLLAVTLGYGAGAVIALTYVALLGVCYLVSLLRRA